MRRKPPLTELRDADIRRVDAVKGPANGTRFLIAKAAVGEAGLVSDEDVRDLIAPDTYLDETGAVIKATADINDLPDSDFAYIEPGGKKDESGKTVPRTLRHFPIDDAAHVRNALARLSSSPFEAKARPAVEAAAKAMGIGEPAAQVTKKKESPMADQKDTTEPKGPFPGAKPPFKKLKKEARAVLKAAKVAKAQAKLAKEAARLRKKTLLAKAREVVPADVQKGALSDLADAHLAVLQALKGCDDPTSDTAKTLQSLADDIASAMSDHAMSEAGDGDGSDGDDTDEPGADDAALAKAAPRRLKAARAIAKAARFERRAMRDRLSIAKAQKTLAKVGRRNASSDQDHLDAADGHLGALGATFHQSGTGTAPTLGPTDLAKSEQVASVVDIIAKAVGPIIGKDLEAIRGDLAQVSEQIAKVAKVPLPGGPRVVLERDGSLIAAPDGAGGLSFEQAALAKVAERYPVGSVAREELQKAAATSAIKELMIARNG